MATIRTVKGGVASAKGFRAAGVAAEIKYKGRNDVALIVADEPCAAAAVFTTNKVAAAPVLYDRQIVKGGRVIARGWNQVEALKDATAHAEMLALTAATSYLGGKYLEGCTIYVTVEPCPMCAAALAWAQVGRIVWGADDPRRGYSLFTPSLLHPKTKTSKGVLADECSTLMKDFFKEKRK